MLAVGANADAPTQLMDLKGQIRIQAERCGEVRRRGENLLQSFVECFARLAGRDKKSFAIIQIETPVRVAPQLIEDRFVLAGWLSKIDTLPAQGVDGKRV